MRGLAPALPLAAAGLAALHAVLDRETEATDKLLAIAKAEKNPELRKKAISWLAHRPGITAPIASATSVAQLKELLAGVELQLDAEARKTLDQASSWREA